MPELGPAIQRRFPGIFCGGYPVKLPGIFLIAALGVTAKSIYHNNISYLTCLQKITKHEITLSLPKLRHD